MKRHLIIMLLLMIAIPTMAQRGGGRGLTKEEREKIKTARVAFITTRLQLTSEAAEKFWPIFNEFETAKEELSKKYNKQKRELAGPEGPRNMSDESASKMLDIYFDQKEAELKLERDFIKRFQGVLSRKQVWSIIRFESDFRREFMNKLRERGRPGSPRSSDDGN